MNNLKLITDHPDYWLLVDTEAEVQKGEICHAPDTSLFRGFTGKCGMDKDQQLQAYKDAGFKFYKIIAHLPKNDTPLLEGVPLLPLVGLHTTDGVILEKNENSFCTGENKIGVKKWYKKSSLYTLLSELPKQEEDADKELKEFIDFEIGRCKEQESKDNTAREYWNGRKFQMEWIKSSLIKMFSKANQKKWSTKQLTEAILFGFNLANDAWNDRKKNGYKVPNIYEEGEKFIQSLSPITLPIGFEPEYECNCTVQFGKRRVQCLNSNNGHCKVSLFKTIKSTYQGKEVEILQGKWIFKN